MKNVLAAAFFLLLSIMAFANNPEIDRKILATFKTIYPDAKDVSWDELPESYVAYFVDGSTRTRILFRKDHSFVYITRYYSKEKLPFYLAYVVANELPGMDIVGVTEVSMVSQPDNQSKIEYYLTMEDDSRWYTVKIDADRNLSVIKKFRKSPGSRKARRLAEGNAG